MQKSKLEVLHQWWNLKIYKMEQQLKDTKDKAAKKHMKEITKLAREISPMIRDKFLWEYLK